MSSTRWGIKINVKIIETNGSVFREADTFELHPITPSVLWHSLGYMWCMESLASPKQNLEHVKNIGSWHTTVHVSRSEWWSSSHLWLHRCQKFLCRVTKKVTGQKLFFFHNVACSITFTKCRVTWLYQCCWLYAYNMLTIKWDVISTSFIFILFKSINKVTLLPNVVFLPQLD